MKKNALLIALFISLCNSVLMAQTPEKLYAGHYRDYFGHHLDIKSDSTFMYTMHFDLTSGWSKGTWRVNKDTILFSVVLVYDTLKTVDKFGKPVSSTLVLSEVEKPRTITIKQDSVELLLLNMQNYFPCPQKLVLRSNKLYHIDLKGKPEKKKFKGIWTNKKWGTWYFREIEKN